MASNEERARLCGWERRMIPVMHGGFAEADGPVYPEPYWFAQDGSRKKFPPQYDTDANAVAELRAFVRKRGKEAEFAGAVFGKTCAGSVDVTWRELWAVIDATPAQQCAAFDATFKDELEKIQ